MTAATLEPAEFRGLTVTVDPAATALVVDDVTKVFRQGPGLINWLRGKRGERKRTVAVDHISFQVEKGEIFGVLGPNGTGKSTLIRLMSTLLMPDSGTVTVFGLDIVKDEFKVKRLINRVSVEASFFKKLSPMENLMYGARLYSVDPTFARAKAKEILNRFGVENSAIGSPMEDMSRGMQQKVAIARAFLTAPVLLLLDEPTTGLDPHSKREVQAAVLEIRNTHDATVMLTTHDMQEADELCDRIAIVDKGRIVALDTPVALKEKVRLPGEGLPSLEDVFLRLTGKKLEEADQENESK